MLSYVVRACALHPCSNFYERLKEVRDFHRKFPDDDLTEVGAVRVGVVRWGLERGSADSPCA